MIPGLPERICRRLKEDSNGCWMWPGAVMGGGYPCVRIRGKQCYGHRAAYEVVNGPIPPGMVVCHRCDVPGCMNPNHLFLGTKKDNSQDMSRKGRCVLPDTRGERHGMAKLTEDDVRGMLSARASGLLCREIAEMYGVSKSTAVKVCARKSWRHMEVA